MEKSSFPTGVVVGVIGIVVVVAGLFMFAPKSDKVVNDNTLPPPATGSKPMVSMKELIASNISQKCTFTSSTETSQSHGDVYVANGKMRGDFESTIKASGKVMKSHMAMTMNRPIAARGVLVRRGAPES